MRSRDVVTNGIRLFCAEDPVLRPEKADGMEARVPHPTRVVIEDCGHWTRQEQPGERNRHLVAFLGGLGRW